MFQKTFDTRVAKYNKFREEFKNGEVLEIVARACGVNVESLNPVADRKVIADLAIKMVRHSMRGNITPEVFSAAVSVILDAIGVQYRKYCGFALSKSIPTFNKELADYNQRVVVDGGNPLFANHLYLECGEVSYDLFRNELVDDFEHLSCLEF